MIFVLLRVTLILCLKVVAFVCRKAMLEYRIPRILIIDADQSNWVKDEDGFVYFVDEDDMMVEKIEPGYCYFKARHVKDRIIPD